MIAPTPSIALAAALLLASVGCARAEDQPPAPATSSPAGCVAPEHRQFDFWLGDWTVRNPAGVIVGENHLTSLHKGCVLFENWTGKGNFTGSSLNIYDAQRKRWHQTWVDVSGGLLELDGEFVDGKMVLAGNSPPDDKGVIAVQRITWTPLPDGRVRQLWQTSTDAGKTWTTVFDGYYSKAK